MVQARSSRVGRPWGGRWLGLDHLLAKCALAHLAALYWRLKLELKADTNDINSSIDLYLTFMAFSSSECDLLTKRSQ
jgi:hypothetical protein